MLYNLQIMLPTQQSLSFRCIKERPSRFTVPPRLIHFLHPPAPMLFQKLQSRDLDPIRQRGRIEDLGRGDVESFSPAPSFGSQSEDTSSQGRVYR